MINDWASRYYLVLLDFQLFRELSGTNEIKMSPPKSKSKGKKGHAENSVPKKEEVKPVEAEKEVTVVPDKVADVVSEKVAESVPEIIKKEPEVVPEIVAPVAETVENGQVEVAEEATEAGKYPYRLVPCVVHLVTNIYVADVVERGL